MPASTEAGASAAAMDASHITRCLSLVLPRLVGFTQTMRLILFRLSLSHSANIY